MWVRRNSSGFDDSIFDGLAFQRHMTDALATVKKILTVERNPQLPADVAHTYADKYTLANFVTNSSIAGQLNVLEQLGLDAQSFATLKEWSASQMITLRFSVEERCKFKAKCKRDLKGKTKKITEVRTAEEVYKKITGVSTTVTEYFWKFLSEWEISAYRGSDPKDKIVLKKRAGKFDIMTHEDVIPRPDVKIYPAVETNITWLFDKVNADMQACFTIDKNHKNCHTPRRNEDITKALKFFAGLSAWNSQVEQYVSEALRSVADGGAQYNLMYEVQPKKLDWGALREARMGVFCPVLPLFEPPIEDPDDEDEEALSQAIGVEKAALAKCATEDSKQARAMVCMQNGGGVVMVGDVNKFLEHQLKTMLDALDMLNKVFGGDVKHSTQICDGCKARPIVGKRFKCSKCKDVDLCQTCREANKLCSNEHDFFQVHIAKDLVSAVEATVALACGHAIAIAKRFAEGVNYIEDMLCKQIIAAIGCEVTADDFAEYMKFHNSRLFLAEYRPKPFCYAIRRPHHVPEGVISIEHQNGGGEEPIHTHVRSLNGDTLLMRFALNAASEVVFKGARYLHTYTMHQFSGHQSRIYTLHARARQFSSYVMMIGTLYSADLFQPKHAIIVQNKDELQIPLLMETIPTPKEFQDMISSLSPEQQRFCQAYRGMQLAGTLFAVLVIQIKPQMEKLLNLPLDSLTKEVKLQQDLMQLFIQYQIPSDLMSYDNDENASREAKIDAVKGHVKSVFATVGAQREEQLEQKQMEDKYNNVSDARKQEPEERESDCDDSDGDDMDEEMECDNDNGWGEVGVANSSSRLFDDGGEAPARALPPARSPIAPTTNAANLSLQDASVAEAADLVSPDEHKVDEAVKDEGGEQQQQQDEAGEEGETLAVGAVDMTKIPKQLDKSFLAYDKDSALRATTIKLGQGWGKKSARSLMSPMVHTTMFEEQLREERNKAFDLLDALTRSGALAVDEAELHVVIAATHCFDKTLLNCVVQDNVNPIEKVECSELIVASTIQAKKPEDLISPSQFKRIHGLGNEKLLTMA